MVLDEPLPSRRPGIRLTDLAAQQGSQGKPERTARGAHPVVCLGMDAMEAFESSLELEVAAGQVRGGRQPVEIVRLERRRLIRAEESLVGLTPRATFVALTAVFKRIHLNHA